MSEAMSLLDLAAELLKRRKGKSLNCRELAALILESKRWSGTKELAQPLSGALQREQIAKGKLSRFIRTAPGRWTFRAVKAKAKTN